MVEIAKRNSEDSAIPKDILDLVDKTFIFKLEIKIDRNAKYDRSYRVKKLCTNDAIVERFKEKFGRDVIVKKMEN